MNKIKSIINARVSILTKSFFLYMMLICLQASAHFGTKGPFGGEVSCAISYDSLVYLGTQNGGVYISSTTALAAWTARPVGLLSGKITALAYSGKYLFAGTADSGVFIFNGYVGSDRYWIRINNGLSNLKIKSLLALDSTTIIAGTDGNGLYKTIDKGATWTAINSALLNNASITGICKAGARLFAISHNKGVYTSDDNGNTWSDFNNVNTSNKVGTNGISYNASNDILIVNNSAGMYTLSAASTTGTPNYTAVQTGLPANIIINGITNNATDWYLATNMGIYTTSITNVSWTSVNSGLNSTNISAVVALQNRLISAAVKDGIYKATAGVHNWIASNSNFSNHVTYSMTTGGDSLIAVATERGVYISKNLATSYKKSNSGLNDSLHVNDLMLSHGILFAATKLGGIYSSSDSGATWTASNTGFTYYNIMKLYTATHHIYAINDSGKIYESGTHTIQWEEIQDGLPANVKPTSIAFYGGKLILGTMGNGVFMRDQHEGPWESFNNGLSNLNVTSVTASARKVFAGTNGSGVFISDFEQSNWSATSATSISHTTMIGLNGNDIQAMSSYAGFVYASYKGGLLATSDNGATWIQGGNQFNLPSFTDVKKICFVNTRVFVTTENNGPYSNALSELPVIQDTIVASIDTIYIPATPSEEAAISVTSNTKWGIATAQNWITLSADSGFRNNEFMAAFSNNTGAARTGNISLSAGTITRNIVVIQEGFVGLSTSMGKQNQIEIHPNPSNGTFTINCSSLHQNFYQGIITDINGKTISNIDLITYQKNISIDMSNFPKGIYIFRINSENEIINTRIVIQ